LQHRQGQTTAEDEPQQTSECSESAQSSSIGQEHKSIHSHSDVKMICQQLQEIKEEFGSFREDFENLKVCYIKTFCLQ
jgi:archaellum component FlaC